MDGARGRLAVVRVQQHPIGQVLDALGDPVAMLFDVVFLSAFAIAGGWLTIQTIRRRLVRG